MVWKSENEMVALSVELMAVWKAEGSVELKESKTGDSRAVEMVEMWVVWLVVMLAAVLVVE